MLCSARDRDAVPDASQPKQKNTQICFGVSRQPNSAAAARDLTMNGVHPAAEALAGASESVLAKINSLYAGSGPESVGLKQVADDLGLHKDVRKPRKKIR